MHDDPTTQARAQRSAALGRCIITLSLLFFLLISLTACQTPPKLPPRPTEFPTYHQLAQRYNQQLKHLHALTARGTIVYNWRDEQGDHGFQGDGRIAVIMPRHLMLKISHSVKGTLMYAGSNEQYYWLFDMRNDKRVYFGRHDQFGPRQRDKLDVPIHPLELPRFLGIVPLDENVQGTPPQVGWRQGCFVVDPPSTHYRLWIDSVTYMTSCVEVLNPDGESIVIATLSSPEPVSIEGRPPDGKIRTATRIEIKRPNHKQTLRLKLSSEHLRNHKIEDKWFDFDRLRNGFKIPPENQFDLDAQEAVLVD